jgi:hypothetical protein
VNVAKDKNIIEKSIWKNPEALTDGNTTQYSGTAGFSSTAYPAYCTLDLQSIYALKLIRFLLYDKDNRYYKFRLLTSTDGNSWQVHYDTAASGTKGWQNFEFPDKIQTRYIRIHCLWNSANSMFHIVQIEAFEDKIPMLAGQESRIIKTASSTVEISDGLPISAKLLSIASAIKDMPKKSPGLDKDYFGQIAADLEMQIYDVEKIEKGMEAIKRQIVDPVNRELKTSNNIGRFSIGLGLIGGLIGIFSLLNSIFKWVGN